MEEIEYNIDNYTNDDLLKLFSLNHDNITEKMVFDVTNYYISKTQNEDNEKMAFFFKSAQDKLIKYLENGDDDSISDDDDDDEEDLEYTDKLISNMEYDENDADIQKIIVPSHSEAKNQKEADKITDRVENTDLIGIDAHFVQKRKNLGISDVMQVPVTQGILNPNLTNKLTKLINVDSQYREIKTDNINCDGSPKDGLNTYLGTSTDFTFDGGGGDISTAIKMRISTQDNVFLGGLGASITGNGNVNTSQFVSSATDDGFQAFEAGDKQFRFMQLKFDITNINPDGSDFTLDKIRYNHMLQLKQLCVYYILL